MKAATESTIAKKTDVEKKAEKEKQRAELEAMRQREAAAAKARRAEDAARQQSNKANIVAQYGQYNEVSESESDSSESLVEDWEIWGDPREARTLILHDASWCRTCFQPHIQFMMYMHAHVHQKSRHCDFVHLSGSVCV
jgi:hypothetical protein